MDIKQIQMKIGEEPEHGCQIQMKLQESFVPSWANQPPQQSIHPVNESPGFSPGNDNWDLKLQVISRIGQFFC